MHGLTLILAQGAVLAVAAGLLLVLSPRRERVRIRADEREPRR